MKRLLIFLFVLKFSSVNAGDSIEIKLNQLSFAANDSIHFSCRIHNYAERGLAAATLNVWIQDVEKKQTWKFRYPVLNGELDASLAIGDSIRPGRYAINFILQKGLYRIQGMLKNNHTHKTLNYMMLLKGNRKLINAVKLDPSGAFVVKNILFEDRSFIVFTPEKKVKKNDLFISISTPLDSAFTPLAVFTQMVEIKPERQETVTGISPVYRFDFDKTYANTTLPEVVVIAKGKKKIEQFEETYATGLFQDENAKTFDGLDSDDIANSIDVESFLEYRIPGLQVNRPDSGSTYMVWRGQPVVVYIDEFRLERGDPISVNPSDVALIKVFNPPAPMNSGFSFGGAIAIYTKKGPFENNTSRRYKFNLKGYTGFTSAWN